MRARLEDEAHKIMPNQWWKNTMPLITISLTAKLVTNKGAETAKIVQDVTRSTKTRKTRRVPLKNTFFTVSSNRRQRLFTVDIGRNWIVITPGGIYIPANEV